MYSMYFSKQKLNTGPCHSIVIYFSRLSSLALIRFSTIIINIHEHTYIPIEKIESLKLIQLKNFRLKIKYRLEC